MGVSLRKFSEFFSEWLYGEDGYYHSAKISKNGDFYTSVSASSLFGGSIANHIYKKIKNRHLKRDATIVEIGANRGDLLLDVIQFLYTFDPSLIDSLKFVVVEPLESLARIQQDNFKLGLGDRVVIERFKNVENLQLEDAFVFANELFDAFACELLYDKKIAYESDFKIEFLKANSDEVLEVASRYGIEKGEIPLGFYQFAKSLFESSKRLEFVTFDYGERGHRGDFNIRIYKEHKTYPLFDDEMNLRSFYKKSDITYDLFFGYLEDEFIRAGFKSLGVVPQNRALVEFGIVELLEILKNRSNEKRYIQEVNRVKTLIDPSFLGERFKMIRFIKNQ